MKKIISIITAVILALSFSSCAGNDDITGNLDEKSFETVSGSIQMQNSSVEEMGDYPSEFPAAQDQPPLDQVKTAGGGQTSPETVETVSLSHAKEVRAVWFSYLEFQKLLTGRDEQQFRANIAESFDRVKGTGFNTVYVQVRPFGDALYPSAIFPWSYLAVGEEGKDPGYDPLQVMIEESRARGLRVEAWINPYRIRSDDKRALTDKNPASQWDQAQDDAVIRFGSGIYYNPGSEKARELIVSGVREIVEAYDVDGIHFDDYFYPTDSAKFDQSTYERYRSQGGKLSLGDWRRENVNLLVKDVYAAVKAANPKALFGISPQGNNANNYDVQFIDTAKWLSNAGYVDYICPQIYFGFENAKAPFEQTVAQWDAMIKVDSIQLIVGLSPYKIGLNDQWAGDGDAEWVENSDMLIRMVEAARTAKRYGGTAMFRYQSLYEPAAEVGAQVKKELDQLEKLF